MKREKIYDMQFAKVYPMLIAKAERKERTRAEVLQFGLRDMILKKLKN